MRHWKRFLPDRFPQPAIKSTDELDKLCEIEMNSKSTIIEIYSVTELLASIIIGHISGFPFPVQFKFISCKHFNKSRKFANCTMFDYGDRIGLPDSATVAFHFDFWSWRRSLLIYSWWHLSPRTSLVVTLIEPLLGSEAEVLWRRLTLLSVLKVIGVLVRFFTSFAFDLYRSN